MASARIKIGNDYLSSGENILFGFIIFIYFVIILLHFFATRTPSRDTNTELEDKITFGLNCIGFILILLFLISSTVITKSWNKLKKTNWRFKTFFYSVYFGAITFSLIAMITYGIGAFHSEEGSEQEFDYKISSLAFSVLTLIGVCIISGFGITDITNNC